MVPYPRIRKLLPRFGPEFDKRFDPWMAGRPMRPFRWCIGDAHTVSICLAQALRVAYCSNKSSAFRPLIGCRWATGTPVGQAPIRSLLLLTELVDRHE
jgi:hypothetical protein